MPRRPSPRYQRRYVEIDLSPHDAENGQSHGAEPDHSRQQMKDVCLAIRGLNRELKLEAGPRLPMLALYLSQLDETPRPVLAGFFARCGDKLPARLKVQLSDSLKSCAAELRPVDPVLSQTYADMAQEWAASPAV